MVVARRTRERITYVVIISVRPGLSKTSPHSAISASSVVPCCMQLVHATSGTSVKPFLEIFAPVALLTSHTRDTGLSGKTPRPSLLLISHPASSNFIQITRGRYLQQTLGPNCLYFIRGVQLPTNNCTRRVFEDRDTRASC